jgi:hypothetical protein
VQQWLAQLKLTREPSLRAQGPAMKKSLLLGAGFSRDFGMPLTVELTEDFLGLFNNSNIKSLAAVLSANQPFGESRPINANAISKGLGELLEYKSEGHNYEALLARLQSLGAASPTQSDGDSYHYLFIFLYELIHKLLCHYQQCTYEVMYEKNLSWFSGIENLLSDKETWVFTLNHDLFFEYLAIDRGIPVTYGDEGSITFPLNNLQMTKSPSGDFMRRGLHLRSAAT